MPWLAQKLLSFDALSKLGLRRRASPAKKRLGATEASEIFRSSGRMAILVLFVDSDDTFFEGVSNELRLSGISPDLAVTGEEALHFLQLHDLDVVVLDAAMRWRGSGTLLEQIKWVSPLTEVIVSVTHDCTDLAIEAMKRGAYDRVVKPMEISELVVKIVNAKKRKTEQEVKIERASMERMVMLRERW
jgi:DNA-binding NtrC family response regulator